MAHFKRALGVNACVVAEAEHAVSLDINVLLEDTPPQAQRVTVRGRRNKGTLCAPESSIKHNGLRIRAHSQENVIYHILCVFF